MTDKKNVCILEVFKISTAIKNYRLLHVQTVLCKGGSFYEYGAVKNLLLSCADIKFY